ncbi:ATP-dependent DNA helicase [Caligus rogercresseyi]|uniref:ATP-dependent DNA helicase n=1 Tax=Caligus rogercresseyi TaxID=217165 RepID=A0A7T8GUH4_CALRO|nr:ATP-dependent DNA helicase [Caligus rogercresseyi]
MGTDCIRLVYKVSNASFQSFILIVAVNGDTRLSLLILESDQACQDSHEIHGDLTPALASPPSRDGTLNSIRVALEEKLVLDENVARVKRLVEDNPRMTTRQVAAEVSLPFTTIFRLLTEDLGLRNLLNVLVPHQLSEANKTQRVKCCQDLLKLFQDHGEDFLGSHLLVEDESGSTGIRWAEASLGGAHGACEEDDDSDGVHLQAEAGIDHSTTCWDHSQPEHHDRDKIRLKDCLLMWKMHFLTRRDVEPVKQSPYSPDVNLCDRFLFRKLKHLLWEDEFGGREEATLAVQRAMRRVSEDDLYDQLRKLQDTATTS